MTSIEIMGGIAFILLAGVVAQLVANRLNIPSILLLLGAGFLAGVTGILDPDGLFGDLLFPFVSLAVAIILYEGGLNLRLREIRGLGGVFFRIIVVGAALTWILTALAARYLLGFDTRMAILLGAILIVSGPTVVTPLLHFVRPRGRVGPLLRWEGIFIDPVGAILAVITLQAILAGNLADGGTTLDMVVEVAITLAVGAVIGLAVAGVLLLVLRYYLVPDMYQNALSLAAVIAAFWLSNYMRDESGLLAVVLMGMALVNQDRVAVQHIIDFKEHLWGLILGSLFIVLGARLDFDHIEMVLNWESLAFLLFLISVVRPLTIVLSTLGSRLNWNERAFMAWIMPRGIVAASVASIFAIELEEHGIAGADLLVPYTFLVIIGTVIVYGFTARPFARYLGLAGSTPQGVLILGAHPFGQEVGLSLMEEGFRVLMVDTNRTNIQGARMAGLPTYYGNVLSEHTIDDMDLDGIGKLLALTGNDEVNSLISVRMAEIFERGNVYQFAPRRVRGAAQGGGAHAQHLSGRTIGKPGLTFDYITQRLREDASLKRTQLTENYDFSTFLEHYGDGARPLFRITPDHQLRIVSEDREFAPQPGDRIISIIDEVEPNRRAAIHVSPGRALTPEEMEEAGLVLSYCDWQASVRRHGGTRPGPGRHEKTPVGD